MDLNELTSKGIGAAIEVHRHLGPGLLESVYEECLVYELHLRGMAFKRQEPLPLFSKGRKSKTDRRRRRRPVGCGGVSAPQPTQGRTAGRPCLRALRVSAVPS
ncbi:MAG: GxxExxY protein [Desulfosoma sp.]